MWGRSWKSIFIPCVLIMGTMGECTVAFFHTHSTLLNQLHFFYSVYRYAQIRDPSFGSNSREGPLHGQGVRADDNILHVTPCDQHCDRRSVDYLVHDGVRIPLTIHFHLYFSPHHRPTAVAREDGSSAPHRWNSWPFHTTDGGANDHSVGGLVFRFGRRHPRNLCCPLRGLPCRLMYGYTPRCACFGYLFRLLSLTAGRIRRASHSLSSSLMSGSMISRDRYQRPASRNTRGSTFNARLAAPGKTHCGP